MNNHGPVIIDVNPKHTELGRSSARPRNKARVMVLISLLLCFVGGGYFLIDFTTAVYLLSIGIPIGAYMILTRGKPGQG